MPLVPSGRSTGVLTTRFQVLIRLLRNHVVVGASVATQAAATLGEMGPLAREAIPTLRAAVQGDTCPFHGAIDRIVIEDEAFCLTVAEALRRIEGLT